MLTLPYGHTELPLVFMPGDRVTLLTPPAQPAPELSECELIACALQNPIGSPRLRELSRNARRVLLITSDHTRPVPSALTLPPMLAEIRQGNPAADIIILIATGMHRPTTPAEMKAKFGTALVARERFEIHCARNDADMVRLGMLPSGGELWLNRLVAWADLVCSDGFIEPHFFAGFSGGRKSILPGVASRRTVLANHNAGFVADPRATHGSLAGNPIHRDMLYAARAAGLRFILNVLLDSQKHVVAAFAGDPARAHEAGCEQCLARCGITGATGDIVITSNGGYPLDQNVYQAVKGITAAEKCVRQGGVVILCAALGDGHGGEDFFRYFTDAQSPRAVADAIAGVPAEQTAPDQWEAQILARVLCRATVVFVTGAENRAIIERMHMRWAPDPAAALAMARALTRPEPEIVVIPDGVNVVIR